MTDPSRTGSSTVPVVGIIAIFALVLVGAWFFILREQNGASPSGTTVPRTESAPPPAVKDDDKVEINVDLPDSVTITP